MYGYATCFMNPYAIIYQPKTKRKQLLNIYREAFLFLYKEYSSVVVL